VAFRGTGRPSVAGLTACRWQGRSPPPPYQTSSSRGPARRSLRARLSYAASHRRRAWDGSKSRASPVIRGNPRKSAAIQSEATIQGRGNQRQSEAIRGNQRQSEAIRGDQRRSEAIRGSERPVAHGGTCMLCVRSSEVIRGYQRQREASCAGWHLHAEGAAKPSHKQTRPFGYARRDERLHFVKLSR